MSLGSLYSDVQRAPLKWLGMSDNTPDFKNPADAARPYFDQVPSTLKPYYEPYIQQGQRAGGNLENQYNEMTNNPSDFLSKISQGYKQSPGYEFKLNQALQAGNNAAAAGGMLGSPAHQQQNEEIGEGLANNDYETWLNHVLGLHDEGQTGLQDFQKQGFGASSDYGTSLSNSLMNHVLLEERSREAENQYNQSAADARSKQFGDVVGLGTKIGSMFLK